MKKFIKIIRFIPLMNFISFFLMAIPMVFIYNMKKEEYFKNFIKIFLGCILFVILINIFSFKNEVIQFIIIGILSYILGIFFSTVALQSIKEVENRRAEDYKNL